MKIGNRKVATANCDATASDNNNHGIYNNQLVAMASASATPWSMQWTQQTTGGDLKGRDVCSISIVNTTVLYSKH